MGMGIMLRYVNNGIDLSQGTTGRGQRGLEWPVPTEVGRVVGVAGQIISFSGRISTAKRPPVAYEVPLCAVPYV